jgi:hypothetical protein
MLDRDAASLDRLQKKQCDKLSGQASSSAKPKNNAFRQAK